MIALVVRVEDTEGGRVHRYAFRRSPVRVGRGEMNDLQLDRPFVSTQHGLVEFDAAGARYVDLGSTNGSSVGGVPLGRNTLVEVPPGAEIAIGSYRLRLERQRADDPRDGGARSTAFDRNSAPEPPLRASARAEAAVAAEALERADERLRSAGPELEERRAAYREARQALRAAVEQVLAPLDGQARRRALERLAGRYPEVEGEPPLVAPPGPAGRSPGRVGDGSPAALGDEALRLLRVFGESYLPEGRVPSGPGGLAGLLGRVAAVLEVVGRALVDLRGSGVGPPVAGPGPGGEGGLDGAGTPEQVIAWLLDPAGDGRDEELERALARLAGGRPTG